MKSMNALLTVICDKIAAEMKYHDFQIHPYKFMIIIFDYSHRVGSNLANHI